MIHPRIQKVLTESATPHQVREHASLGVPIRSPADFAGALGYDVQRIAKTLFLRDNTGRFVLATLPAPAKVNFDAVAQAVGAKRVQMGTPEELASTLDYPRHGVSPLGAGDLPVVLDQGLLAHPTILVGGGITGEEIELAPDQLQQLSRAIIKPIAIA